MPPADVIERVIDTLAQHHAYWWDHALLDGTTFHIGYWSRNAERFALYLQRRRISWDSLVANEAAWFPERSAGAVCARARSPGTALAALS